MQEPCASAAPAAAPSHAERVTEIQDKLAHILGELNNPARPRLPRPSLGKASREQADSRPMPPSTEKAPEAETPTAETLSRLPKLEATIADLLARFDAIETAPVEPLRDAARAEVRRIVESEREAATAPAPLAAAIDLLRGDILAMSEKRMDDVQRLEVVLDHITDRLDRLEQKARQVRRDKEAADLEGRSRRFASSLLESLGLVRRGSAVPA